MMMSKNITRALTARGLSFPHVLAKSCFAGLQLALAFTFLIIGFNAFSDPKDPAAGMLNSALTLILAVVGLQLGRAVDLEEMHEQVERLETEVMVDIQETIDILARQVEQASSLIAQMRMSDGSSTGSSDSSQSSVEEEEEEEEEDEDSEN